MRYNILRNVYFRNPKARGKHLSGVGWRMEGYGLSLPRAKLAHLLDNIR